MAEIPLAQISLAEELRFLAAQCVAHVESTHRDQDRQFVASLVMQLNLLGDDPVLALVIKTVTEWTSACPPLILPAHIRLASLLLSHAASIIERRAEKAVAA